MALNLKCYKKYQTFNIESKIVINKKYNFYIILILDT